MSLTISPLSDALGAEVNGIAWEEDIDLESISQIHEALMQYHLLCLRSAPLTSFGFAKVARYFGEPQLQLLRDARDPEVKEVSVFDSTYKNAEHKPADLSLDRRSGWHTDDSYFAVPAKITLLQALEIPSSGGETRFCNACAAYDALSADQKTELNGLRAVHSYDTMRAPARAVKRNAAEEADTVDVVHPLIRTHDESAKKAIYFNSNRTDRVVDMERTASDELLDRIHAHMTQPK
jgi:taurine dioxygenase